MASEMGGRSMGGPAQSGAVAHATFRKLHAIDVHVFGAGAGSRAGCGFRSAPGDGRGAAGEVSRGMHAARLREAGARAAPQQCSRIASVRGYNAGSTIAAQQGSAWN
ncbi:MAG: hypothetical protein V4801_28405 [Burkholderia gladioli]